MLFISYEPIDGLVPEPAASGSDRECGLGDKPDTVVDLPTQRWAHGMEIATLVMSRGFRGLTDRPRHTISTARLHAAIEAEGALDERLDIT